MRRPGSGGSCARACPTGPSGWRSRARRVTPPAARTAGWSTGCRTPRWTWGAPSWSRRASARGVGGSARGVGTRPAGRVDQRRHRARAHPRPAPGALAHPLAPGRDAARIRSRHAGHPARDADHHGQQPDDPAAPNRDAGAGDLRAVAGRRTAGARSGGRGVARPARAVFDASCAELPCGARVHRRARRAERDRDRPDAGAFGRPRDGDVPGPVAARGRHARAAASRRHAPVIGGAVRSRRASRRHSAVACTGPDPVRGHTYGLALPDADRRALVSYLQHL